MNSLRWIASLALMLSACSPDESSVLHDLSIDQSRREVVAGDQLPSNFDVGRVDGKLVFSAPPPKNGGCISYGPYSSQLGVEATATASITFESHFQNLVFEDPNACYGEPGFVVDLIAKDGDGNPLNLGSGDATPWRKKLYRQDFDLTTISFEPIHGRGGIRDLELRICNIISPPYRNLEMKVHDVTIDWRWTEVCTDPVRCPSEGELREFMHGIRANKDLHFKNLISNRAYYYLAKKSEHLTACLIRSLADRDQMSDLAARLTSDFSVNFNKPFDPQAYSCDAGATLAIENESCPPENVSEVCMAARNFLDTKKWFLDNIAALEGKKATETVARGEGLRQEIEALLQSLAQLAGG